MYYSHSWANEGTASRASNGKAPRMYSDSYAFTAPIAEGGTYNITLGGRGVANNATVDLYVGTKSSNNAVIDMVSKGTFSSWTNGGIAENTIEGVVVEPGQVIVLKNPNASANCYVEADYIYYTKTADYTVSATIGATGWTTFASPYALDLSDLEGVTAYYAKTIDSTNKKVIIEKTTAAVPAGEGLLLKGTAGTVTIPVVATGTAISGNKLVGCTANTELAANANYYVLVSNEGAAEFQCLDQMGATIPAGKAYLNAGTTGGARLSITFSDDATSISSVENANVENAHYYNLNGQRTLAPQKGLYIVNGKKVVLK